MLKYPSEEEDNPKYLGGRIGLIQLQSQQAAQSNQRTVGKSEKAQHNTEAVPAF